MSEKTAKDIRWHNMGLTKDGKLRHPADGLAWKAFDARTWPVVLIPYNLPPWICMKQQSLILSSIIPGGKAPGDDIDIYLIPLIKELKLLWKGVDAYNAFSKQRFKLRASLLWTVNDFPAYANLSGWSTKGRVACPVCTSSTHSTWLKHGRKFCYMGHRRWLEPNHNYRSQMDRFDGTIETEGPPSVLTGSDILKQLRGTTFKYGKYDKSSKKRTERRL
ncbi:transposon, En/Spm-like protein [Tanacetum coccineum]